MKVFNNTGKIAEAKPPWTIWGATTEVANFIHSTELRCLPMIRNQLVRKELNQEAGFFGALFTYRQPKVVRLARQRAQTLLALLARRPKM
jgi:hypothetical protein